MHCDCEYTMLSGLPICCTAFPLNHETPVGDWERAATAVLYICLLRLSFYGGQTEDMYAVVYILSKFISQCISRDTCTQQQQTIYVTYFRLLFYLYLIGLMYNIANSQIPLVNCQFLPEMIFPIILTKMGIEQPMAGRPRSPPPIFLSFAYFSPLQLVTWNRTAFNPQTRPHTLSYVPNKSRIKSRNDGAMDQQMLSFQVVSVHQKLVPAWQNKSGSV